MRSRREPVRADGPAVRLDDVVLGYDGHPPIVEIPALALPGRGLVALVGPNGGGKSTLLAAIAGLLPPRRGRVDVAGPVACAFQQNVDSATLPLTVEQLVAMGRWRHLGVLGRPKAADRRAVSVALERLDVVDLAKAQLAELSVGQRRRAHIAMALAQDAPVLLLDEPGAGLDVASRQRIADAVLDEAGDRLVVMATHDDDADLAPLILSVADRCCCATRPDDPRTVGAEVVAAA